VEFLFTNILSGEYHRDSPATSRIWETVTIRTYSRSQGLFAGAPLEGTVLVAHPDKTLITRSLSKSSGPLQTEKSSISSLGKTSRAAGMVPKILACCAERASWSPAINLNTPA